MEANFRSKGQGHWERICKNRLSALSLISSSKVDQLSETKTIMITGPFYTSSISNTFHQRKCLVYVIICNDLGGPHISAAIRSCIFWFCTHQVALMKHLQ